MLRVALALVLAVAAATVVALLFTGGEDVRTLASNGVEVQVPAGWDRIESAGDGGVVDPVTVLVVGTHGARTRLASCQVAAYWVPPRGAVVVVVRWRTETSGGGRPQRSRDPLERIELDPRGFECWPGHLGGAAQVALGGHAYQVNVLIGDRASTIRIEQALSVARSFDLER